MQQSDELKDLLTQIRDLQRDHLAEYRKVTQQSLELQQRAVSRQEQMVKLYMRVVVVGALMIVFIVILLIYVLGRIRQY